MFVNGIVIQRYADIPYKGIDGSGYSYKTNENWFLFDDDERLSEEFDQYYDKHIGMTYINLYPHSWVNACTDTDFIRRYMREAEKHGIRYRLLLCETDIIAPVMIEPVPEAEFLGYDYAYANGDNYSAVYNEIPGVFPQFSLNGNGLFDTEEEIHEYIAERDRFVALHPPYTLEAGDFTIFRLSEIDPRKLRSN